MALWAYTDPRQNPAEFARDVAEQIQCTTETNQLMVDCLRTKNASELIKYSPAPSVSIYIPYFIIYMDHLRYTKGNIVNKW